MMTNWFFLISVAGISSVIFNYLNRYILKDSSDSTPHAWWLEVIRTLLFLPFCFFVKTPQINLQNIILFLGIGISEFFSVYFYMKMHSASELSVSTIVSQMRLIWVPIFAFLFLNEHLTIPEYFGIVLVLLGQIVVISPKKLSLDKGIKLAFLSSIFVAANSILAKKAAPVFAPPFTVVAMGLPAIFCFPFFMKDAKKRINLHKNGFIKKIIVAVIFNAMTMVFMLMAFKFGPVSKVIGVFQSMSILAVFAGIFLLHEKGNLYNKVFGSLIVFLGMFLLL
jgi:drug/metabolite transporter (DMT)-like permease